MSRRGSNDSGELSLCGMWGRCGTGSHSHPSSQVEAKPEIGHPERGSADFSLKDETQMSIMSCRAGSHGETIV